MTGGESAWDDGILPPWRCHGFVNTMVVAIPTAGEAEEAAKNQSTLERERAAIQVLGSAVMGSAAVVVSSRAGLVINLMSYEKNSWMGTDQNGLTIGFGRLYCFLRLQYHFFMIQNMACISYRSKDDNIP